MNSEDQFEGKRPESKQSESKQSESKQSESKQVNVVDRINELNASYEKKTNYLKSLKNKICECQSDIINILEETKIYTNVLIEFQNKKIMKLSNANNSNVNS